jgi:choline dehydrogenase-like flavoprotein
MAKRIFDVCIVGSGAGGGTLAGHLAQRGVNVAIVEGGPVTIHVRKATGTKASPTRPACHYCGNCMAGCDVAAKYNSADVHLAPAMKTGCLTVFPDSVVREVTVSKQNRANGVIYHNRLTGTPAPVSKGSASFSCLSPISIRKGWLIPAANWGATSFPTSTLEWKAF